MFTKSESQTFSSAHNRYKDSHCDIGKRQKINSTIDNISYLYFQNWKLTTKYRQRSNLLQFYPISMSLSG